MTHSKHWLGLGALLLAVALFGRLGFWQLSRADENSGIEARFASAADLPVLRWPVSSDLNANRYRLLQLTGTYQLDRQILLDNITENGQAGYEVLTPFVLADGNAVLVNRGWLPAAADRSVLPDVAFGPETDSVFGRIDRLPRAAWKLEATPVSTGEVTVMSFPAVEDIEAVLERELANFQLLLDEREAHGYLRHWAPEAGRAERNIGYAVQWFGLMTLALVLAVGVHWRWMRSLREKS